MSVKPRFLVPGENSWQEDKVDIDAHISTQFVYNPNHSLAFDLQRKRLPIYKLRSHIIYLLEKYQTLVLVGETGCGKSTQVPQVFGRKIVYACREQKAFNLLGELLPLLCLDSKLHPQD